VNRGGTRAPKRGGDRRTTGPRSRSGANLSQTAAVSITLGSFQTWKIAQDGNLDEAKKVAAGVAEDQEYQDLIDTFANGGTANIPLGVAHDETVKPRITSGEYGGVQATGLGLIEFTKQAMLSKDQTHPDYVNVVVRLEQGTAPGSMRWVLVKTVTK
jgi:hypothetical protein